ncbi:MAG: DUF3179 domain-containing protein [Chloroflexi bacterium]|nr:DUF3179 domain-containing protein [Chloroflexota bacterium]
MKIARYIATYVHGSRSGLRQRRALAILIAASTITAACTGAFPDVTIDPTDLASPDQRDLGAPPAEGAEVLGTQAASSREAPSANVLGPAKETFDALESLQQAEVKGIAGTGVADGSASVDVEPDSAVGLSVFERLNPDGPKLLDPRKFDQRLPLDAIKPIYEPLVGSPDEVELDADELVMGVSINGESRAYPIRVLRFREMVNDELGGTPILVTW